MFEFNLFTSKLIRNEFDLHYLWNILFFFSKKESLTFEEGQKKGERNVKAMDIYS